MLAAQGTLAAHAEYARLTATCRMWAGIRHFRVICHRMACKTKQSLRHETPAKIGGCSLTWDLLVLTRVSLLHCSCFGRCAATRSLAGCLAFHQERQLLFVCLLVHMLRWLVLLLLLLLMRLLLCLTPTAGAAAVAAVAAAAVWLLRGRRGDTLEGRVRRASRRKSMRPHRMHLHPNSVTDCRTSSG